MNEWMIFLGKSTLILTLCYVGYWALLRVDTHFTWRRVYLLSSLFLSLVLPLLPQVFTHSYEFIPEFIVLTEGSTSPELTPNDPNSPTFTIWGWMRLIYVTGMGIMVFRLGNIILQVVRLFRSAQFVRDENGYRAYSPLVKSPLSFFSFIFLPTAEQKDAWEEMIIDHEHIHITQRHYVDIVLGELWILFQWFNPVSWGMKKALAELHEYLVDEEMLKKGYDKKNYQKQILRLSVGDQKYALANAFTQLSTFKRINMMNRKRSYTHNRLKYLALVPLTVLSLWLTSGFQLPTAIPLETASVEKLPAFMVKGQVFSADKKEPLIGATVVIKGTHHGTITDSQGKFLIEVKDGTSNTLWFSYKDREEYFVPVKTSGNLLVFLGTSSGGSSHIFTEEDLPLVSLEKQHPGVSAAAMYIIDGKEVSQVDGRKLNPNQIEAIEVLKGDKAIDKYGEKAKGGVIIITTKKN